MPVVWCSSLHGTDSECDVEHDTTSTRSADSSTDEKTSVGEIVKRHVSPAVALSSGSTDSIGMVFV